MSFMFLLNEKAREIKQRFDKIIEGQNEELPVWKRCLQAVGFNSFETDNFALVASRYAKCMIFLNSIGRWLVGMGYPILEVAKDTFL